MPHLSSSLYVPGYISKANAELINTNKNNTLTNVFIFYIILFEDIQKFLNTCLFGGNSGCFGE